MLERDAVERTRQLEPERHRRHVGARREGHVETRHRAARVLDRLDVVRGVGERSGPYVGARFGTHVHDPRGRAALARATHTIALISSPA